MTTAANEKLNPALEQAIIKNPDDRAAWARYTKWLVENGNPRGELAECQLALDEEPEDETLAEIQTELLWRHAEQVRGEYPSKFTKYLEDFCNVTYRGGFWHTVHFSGPAAAFAALLAHPSARLLHTLSIAYIDDGEDYANAVAILCQHGPHRALRELRIGAVPEGQNELAGFADRSCGALDGLDQSCPKLQILRLLCPDFRPGKLPHLRLLDARMGATPASLTALADSQLPALRELHLGVEAVDDDEDAAHPELAWEEESLDRFLTGTATPALRRLVLWCMPATADTPWADRIQESPLGERLESFELGDWDEMEEHEAAVYAL